MAAQDIFDGLRAVLFDVSGTVLHPRDVFAVYHQAGVRHGSRLREADVTRRFVAAFRAEDKADERAGWQTSRPRERERWRNIVTATLPDADHGACFRELYDHFARPEAWQLDADVPALWSALLERGLTVGLATNLDERLPQMLAGFPALASANPVVVSADVGYRKPAPEFFTEAVRQCGCLPGEVLLVGDDEGNDYLGAQAAGLQAVLVEPRGRGRGRIARLGELLDARAS